MKLVESVHQAFLKSGKTLALAESCTGGAIAAAITAIPDASKFFLGSLVVYSNVWKEEFLGVSSDTLDQNGAVSAETVQEMIRGLFVRTDCDYAVAISGIAGPSGGTDSKPVGTIYIGVGRRGEKADVKVKHGPKTRKEAIAFAVEAACEMILEKKI